MGGYGKTISHVIIGLKTAKGTKQLKVSMCLSSVFSCLRISPHCMALGKWRNRSMSHFALCAVGDDTSQGRLRMFRVQSST